MCRFSLPGLLLVGMVFLLMGNVAHAQGKLYAMEGYNSLITIDPLTGKGTSVGPITVGMAPNGIAFRGAKLYTWDSKALRVTELDPATGATIAQIDVGGTVVSEGDIAFRSDGIGFISGGSPGGKFESFDLTTLKTTVIKNSLNPVIDGLAFNAKDVLYGLAEGGVELHIIDQTTGATTLVGKTGVSGGGYLVSAIAFDAADNLFAVIDSGSQDSSLYKIDVSTGKATLIGATGFKSVLGLNFQLTGTTPTAGVTITESGGSTDTTEGGATDTYDVVLKTAPTAPVTITLTPDSEVTVSPATLTFTPANWQTLQTVTVTPVDDSKVEGPHKGVITHSAASSDTAYSGITIASITANITDNDSGGGGGGGVLYATSGWSTDNFLSIDPATGKGTLIGKATRTWGLDFYQGKLYVLDANGKEIKELDPKTGTTLKTIPLSGSIGGGEGDMAIRASDGAGFIITSGRQVTQFDLTGKTTALGSVNNVSVDGMAFHPTTGVLYLLSESGHELYTVDMTTWKTTLIGKTGIKGSDPGGLAFDNSGKLYAVVGRSGLGSPADFYTIDPVSAKGTLVGAVGFNDIHGIRFMPTAGTSTSVTITESGGSTVVAEGGATDTYDVVLTTAPTANVTITLTPDSEVTVSPATLTFTPSNWQTAQTVTVTAVDDSKVEGPHKGTITHSAASSDTAYSGITIANVTTNITDNDSGGGGGVVTITESGGSTAVAEGSAGDSYTVVLTTAPTANVTITLNAGSQVTVAPATLLFTPVNWQTPQTVTVTAVDDSAVEGTHTGTITHSAASSDTAYNGITINSVTMTITDNDSSGGGGGGPGVSLKTGGIGEGNYFNTRGPTGSEGSCTAEGAYLLAALPQPRLVGPFAVDAQGNLTPLQTALPVGDALVCRGPLPRSSSEPASTPGSAMLAVLAASVALLLGAGLVLRKLSAGS